ncbi:hypothetical protein T492DRAFT_847160 [Pavlovales sp. CCMP2436]|nr:hypothetical protein T492DRAFT_847160 [Pavlovales sp. CCMP2436]
MLLLEAAQPGEIWSFVGALVGVDVHSESAERLGRQAAGELTTRTDMIGDWAEQMPLRLRLLLEGCTQTQQMWGGRALSQRTLDSKTQRLCFVADLLMSSVEPTLVEPFRLSLGIAQQSSRGNITAQFSILAGLGCFPSRPTVLKWRQMMEAQGKTHRCGRVDGMRPLYGEEGGLVPMAVILDNLDLAGGMGNPQGVHVLAAGAKALVTMAPPPDDLYLDDEEEEVEDESPFIIIFEARRLVAWERGAERLLAALRLSGHSDAEARRVGLEQLAAGEPFEPGRFVARRVLKSEDKKGPVPVARSAEGLDSYYPPLAQPASDKHTKHRG